MTVIFETKRLLLYPTLEDDAIFIFELLNSPKWLKYIGDRNIKSIEDAKIFIQNKVIPHFEKKGFGTFTVLKKSDRSKIGTCGLYTRDEIEGVDLGFAFLPQYEKNGYALEASIKEYRLSYLNAYTTKDNFSSQKLLEKLGFMQKGVIKLPTNNDNMLLFKKTI